jgi:hypothetical protein
MSELFEGDLPAAGEAQVQPAEGTEPAQANGHAEPEVPADWHAEAGRKGARRVHQLIQRGLLYEQEHGLKRGRQRLRQLIELGKLYEQDHGLGGRKARPGRLGRMSREELLRTLLRCLVRIAKPSYREALVRLVEALEEKPEAEVRG